MSKHFRFHFFFSLVYICFLFVALDMCLYCTHIFYVWVFLYIQFIWKSQVQCMGWIHPSFDYVGPITPSIPFLVVKGDIHLLFLPVEKLVGLKPCIIYTFIDLYHTTLLGKAVSLGGLPEDEPLCMLPLCLTRPTKVTRNLRRT